MLFEVCFAVCGVTAKAKRMRGEGDDARSSLSTLQSNDAAVVPPVMRPGPLISGLGIRSGTLLGTMTLRVQ
jgi:hypothetical protein